MKKKKLKVSKIFLLFIIIMTSFSLGLTLRSANETWGIITWLSIGFAIGYFFSDITNKSNRLKR